MIVTPHTREELSRALAQSSANATRVSSVDLRHLRSVLEHNPEDMTATVEAGMMLSDFQGQLRRAGQWLPCDPPNASTLSIGDLLAGNHSGPRRFGYGTIRDYLIGIKVALASGEIIKAGGKVVKNVAGYDLGKLFIGAKHTLGIIVEGTFKLRPLPEREIVLESSFDSVRELETIARALLDSPATPVILDAHNKNGRLTLIVAFAGSGEDVEYQLKIAHDLASWSETSTAYDERYPNVISVLPSRTAESLEPLNNMQGVQFVTRFGNGVIYHNGAPTPKGRLPNAHLISRVKQTFDPAGIFPEYNL